MAVRQDLTPGENGDAPELLLREDGNLLAALRATGAAPLPPPPGGRIEAPRLSRFALLRSDPDAGRMVLECPLGLYRMVIHDATVSAFFCRLGLPPGPAAGLPSSEAVAVLLDWLKAMNALAPEEDHAPESGKASREDATLAHWEFHDLLFHAQSRPGRRAGRIRPYRWRGVFLPLPVTRPAMGERLPLPDPGPLPDRSIGEVLASRRSRRSFADDPLPLDALSTFLAHACRIRNLREDPLGGISFRPSPSAGALHGLEIYLLAERCTGLARGLYHYDPLGHGLERLPLPADEKTEKGLALLAEQTRRMAASSRTPAACFVLTCRFRRYQWKYAQIAYSVMLKDLGCLHQTMSLTAEALGMASVILGDTPGEPFLSLAGLPWLEESPVGSFSLGWPDTASRTFR